MENTDKIQKLVNEWWDRNMNPEKMDIPFMGRDEYMQDLKDLIAGKETTVLDDVMNYLRLEFTIEEIMNFTDTISEILSKLASKAYDVFLSRYETSEHKLLTYKEFLKESSQYDNENTDIEFVDLGLPSGTLWADCNVGANTPEEYGGYFTFEEAQKQGEVPSEEQFIELKKNCNYKWMTQNRVVGGLFTSKINGNSIFLPAAGCCDDSKSYNVDSCGYYWSSSEYGDNYIYMYFYGDGAWMNDSTKRTNRLPIRLVK